MRKDKDSMNIENNLSLKSVLWYSFTSIWWILIKASNMIPQCGIMFYPKIY